MCSFQYYHTYYAQVTHIMSPEFFLAAPNPSWDVCDETIPFSSLTMLKCVNFILLYSQPILILDHRSKHSLDRHYWITTMMILSLFIAVLCSRIAVIIGETIALVVSWRKAMGTVQEAIRHNLKVSLSRTLIQNGEDVYIIIFLMPKYSSMNNRHCLVPVRVHADDLVVAVFLITAVTSGD